MHPDATDSSGAGLSPAPATGAGGRPSPGARDERRRESRGDAEAAAAVPRDPGGSSWRVAVAVAAVAAVALSFLAPGCWETAGGAGPCTVLLRLILYLSCAAAAFLLGTLLALVCRSRRAPPPDFVATWSRLAAAVRRPPEVSTGLGCLERPRPHRGPPRFRCEPPALRDPAGGGVVLLAGPGSWEPERSGAGACGPGRRMRAFRGRPAATRRGLARGQAGTQPRSPVPTLRAA